MNYNLKPITRYVTGHDENGKAIVVSSREVATERPFPESKSRYAVLYETSEFPPAVMTSS
jgi:hypothetical protein